MRSSEFPVEPWPAWQRMLFRFFFIFYCAFIGPWTFLWVIPKSPLVLTYLEEGVNAISLFLNKLLFHIPPATKQPNGNGDYPEQWMLVAACTLLAAVGCVLWSVIDRKRKEYYWLNYWFSLGVRYFIILNGFTYGLVKMFGLQMPFPNLSQLTTPLGDYLPMRFSWMFIGYSTPYQFFSGALEVLSAVLLLFRKTATLGVLMATGVFFNVMMLNLSYDIPVKINSISLVVMCLYLLVQELPRLYRFFFLQQAVPSHIFVFPFNTKRKRRIATAAKWAFVLLALYGEFDNDIARRDQLAKRKMPQPLSAGIYDVILHTKMGDTITVNMPDSVYWQNLVLDRGYEGSIKVTDSRFRQRYGRGYFSFQIDSSTKLLSLKRTPADSGFFAQFTYQIKDSTLVELYSYPNRDSMYVLLRKRSMPFPLSERPFHWVSETNR
jgi:hypothetical protein